MTAFTAKFYMVMQQRVEIAQISPGLYCRTHFFG